MSAAMVSKQMLAMTEPTNLPTASSGERRRPARREGLSRATGLCVVGGCLRLDEQSRALNRKGLVFAA